jgi:hypothetical protein
LINGRPFNAAFVSMGCSSGGELAEIGTSLAEDDQSRWMDPELNSGECGSS